MPSASDRVSRASSDSDATSDLSLDDLFESPMRSGPPQYVDLDTLNNADSLVSIISMRISSGVITFAIFKEFERDRRRQRTSFVAETLAQSYRDLLDITIRRLEEIRSSPELLQKLLKDAGLKSSQIIEDLMRKSGVKQPVISRRSR